VTCADGETCVDGQCVDVCEPAVCPGGAQCSNGMCGEPSGGGASGAGGAQGGSGGAIIQGGNGNGNGGGSAGVLVVGGSGGAAGSQGGSELGTPPKGDPGCACRAAAPESGRVLPYAAIGLGALLLRRRRVRGQRAL
jgi:MYXO-CTERM domain-containing protein